MVNRLLKAIGPVVIGVSGPLLFACACASDKNALTETGTDSAAVSVQDKGHLPTHRRSSPDGHGAVAIGQGVNTIFGIKIPTGMVPAAGPLKVYRFEGKQPLSQVAYLIKKQVQFKAEVREGEGYLFRFAKSPKDKEMRELAIRVFDAEDRTVLDIWKEKAYQHELPNRESKEAFRGLPVHRAKPIHYDRAQKMHRQERLSEAMATMKKMQSKTPLTERERQSELFY